ncbi:MAG TPA: anti-sigma factor [Bacteroidia bacterium]|nr:anti-sigma factor [Bacteroidia bacterium]HRG51658.1 anti-sigma factor [Bacteroidia bacterium]
MNTSDYISSGILESYVLDQLSDKEREEVKQMALKYPEIQAELIAIENTLEQYAMDAAKEPPAYLKEKIADQLQFNGDPISISETKKRVISIYWFAAASVALLLSLTYNYYLSEELTDVKNELVTSQVDKQYFASQFETQKAAYDDAQQHLAIIAQNGNKTVILKGLDIAPNAIASIYWNQSSKEVYLNVSEIPAPPADKQYQLWAIVNGKPVDAGIFELTANVNTTVLQKMKPIADAQAFAITLEKKGGVQVPTLNAMYLVGNV